MHYVWVDRGQRSTYVRCCGHRSLFYMQSTYFVQSYKHLLLIDIISYHEDKRDLRITWINSKSFSSGMFLYLALISNNMCIPLNMLKSFHHSNSVGEKYPISGIIWLIFNYSILLYYVYRSMGAADWVKTISWMIKWDQTLFLKHCMQRIFPWYVSSNNTVLTV